MNEEPADLIVDWLLALDIEKAADRGRAPFSREVIREMCVHQDDPDGQLAELHRWAKQDD